MKITFILLFVFFAACTFCIAILANVNGRPLKVEKIALAGFASITVFCGYFALFGGE